MLSAKFVFMIFKTLLDQITNIQIVMPAVVLAVPSSSKINLQQV